MIEGFAAGEAVPHGPVYRHIAEVDLIRHVFEVMGTPDDDNHGYLEIIEFPVLPPGVPAWPVVVHTKRADWGHFIVGFDSVEAAEQAKTAVWRRSMISRLTGYQGESHRVWFYRH